MSIQVYVNGQFVDKEKAMVSVWDHGFLYGDGVFEGIRAYAGRIFRLDEHLKRLYSSAHSLCIQIPIRFEEMREAHLEACRRNQIVDGYIRTVVSRGVGDLGLDPRKCPTPSVIIIADLIKLYPESAYQNGLSVIIASVRRPPAHCLDAKIKSLNYLNNIMGKIEANNAQVDEAVLLNVDGYVTECTAENIFVVRDGVLYTPERSLGFLEGITRQTVLEVATQLGIPTREGLMTAHDLYVADEFFLTGTGAELIPVITVAGRQVGTGKPGPIFRDLLEAFRQKTRSEGTPIHPAHSATP